MHPHKKSTNPAAALTLPVHLMTGCSRPEAVSGRCARKHTACHLNGNMPSGCEARLGCETLTKLVTGGWREFGLGRNLGHRLCAISRPLRGGSGNENGAGRAGRVAAGACPVGGRAVLSSPRRRRPPVPVSAGRRKPSSGSRFRGCGRDA